jgi:hypothetical protein
LDDRILKEGWLVPQNTYVRTTWVNDSEPPLNADNLNKIEQGIVDAHIHMATKNNPHGVTAEQIGAATEAKVLSMIQENAYVYHATLTATLDTDDWTGTEAPFTQVQAVSGILADDAPIVDVVLSGNWEVDKARLEAWGYIYRIVTSNDSITAYAREKPDVALPLQLKVVR